MRTMTFAFPAIERLIYGKPAAETLRAESNRSANEARQRLVAEALGRPGEEAADVIAALIGELGMPRRLTEVGIGQEKLSLIAANAMHDRWLHTNPVRIHSAEQILQILESAA